METPKNLPKGLKNRHAQIVERLTVNPGGSFPESMVTSADLEGFYRFVKDDRISPELLMGQAVVTTRERVMRHKEVVVAHDTTECHFSTEREGLGRMANGGHGVFLHCALAIAADIGREVLGAVSMAAHTRSHERGPAHAERLLPEEERESLRWWTGVELAEEELSEFTDCIHVMDREADAYPLLAKLCTAGHRFVIRIKTDRNLEDERLFTAVRKLPGVAVREVVLSSRKTTRKGKTSNLTRQMRPATLEFAAGSIRVPRPKGVDKSHAGVLTLNVVHVREVNPPEGAEAVDWKLFTTEEVSTPEAILRVVDLYRARWRIEEFFMGLKTGCSIEKRQLESLDALLNAIALLVPIAVDMLRLRTEGRERPDAPASIVLNPLQISLLEADRRLKPGATTKDAMYAVAGLGGHIKWNGDPGWRTLAKGFLKLREREEGARAIQRLARDQS